MKLKNLSVLNLKIDLIVLGSNHIVCGIQLRCAMNLQVVKIMMNKGVQYIIRIVQLAIKIVLMVCSHVKII